MKGKSAVCPTASLPTSFVSHPSYQEDRGNLEFSGVSREGIKDEWKPRFRSGIVTNLSSRTNLEWLVRRRLAADPRVSFRDECDMVDLTFDRANRQVTGILVRPRGHADGASAPVEELRADLVVDASGRDSGAYPAGFARDFQRRLARIQRPVWLLATGEDFRYPQTEGERPGPLAHLFHRYVDRVLIAATSSPAVHQRFLEVLHLLKPPTALFGPDIVTRVLASIARGESVKTGDLGRASHPSAPGRYRESTS